MAAKLLGPERAGESCQVMAVRQCAAVEHGQCKSTIGALNSPAYAFSSSVRSRQPKLRTMLAARTIPLMLKSLVVAQGVDLLPWAVKSRAHLGTSRGILQQGSPKVLKNGPASGGNDRTSRRFAVMVV